MSKTSEKGGNLGEIAPKVVKQPLFDPSALEEPKAGALPGVEADGLPSLKGLSVLELLALRTQIEALLPANKLGEIDLETELLYQFQQAKFLMTTTSSAPANQRAQVANSAAALLEQLIKLQTKLYSAERLKALEQALIKTLKTLPREAQDAFFLLYEKLYADSQGV